MTLPKRWLEDENAASALRDVLRADRDMEPPADAEKAVWAALAAQIAAASAGAGASVGAGASAKAAAGASTMTGASATSATGAVSAIGGGLLKSILMGTFAGIVAVSGYSALEPASAPVASAPQVTAGAPGAPAISAGPRTKPGDRSRAPEPSGTAATEPGSASPAGSADVHSQHSTEPSSGAGPAPRGGAGGGEPPGAAASAEPASGATGPAPGSAEERESRLREESEMLRQARAALRGGDTGGAMRLLEQARQKFPGGVLGQEREALAIETLAKSGARDVASARAAAFIQAHPQSPHAARLQVYVLP